MWGGPPRPPQAPFSLLHRSLRHAKFCLEGQASKRKHRDCGAGALACATIPQPHVASLAQAPLATAWRIIVCRANGAAASAFPACRN